VHVFENNVKQHFQLRLGYINYRFMYGADLPDRLWTSNKIYDLFFCHGQNDSNEMKRLYNKPTIIMGYPRYDNNFVIDCNAEKQNPVSTDKKTILWITTVSTKFSTIETYETAIKNLSNNYKVILRPHPLEINPKSPRFKQNVWDIVNSGKFLTNIKSSENLNDLYALADIVLVDYGGAIYSAVYLEKRVLLLNHPDALNDIGIVESNSMDARLYLPSVDPDDAHLIESYISDEGFWEKWRARQLACRKKYFGDIRGGSAKIVADHLNSLNLFVKN
jgi:CDP-glycerol glycerophosphotransferase (TagB/SpsB family)